MNKVILLGNLGADPETRYTQDGKAVTNFRIATSERWTDRDGNKQERTEWHRIVTWEKLAENCGYYLSKGSKVLVEGKITTREWKDKDGNRRWTTEVVARIVQFLSPKDGTKQDAPVDQPSGNPQANAYADAGNAGFDGFDPGAPTVSDDDVPF
jgi:single-strand DNA-binding protein